MGGGEGEECQLLLMISKLPARTGAARQAGTQGPDKERGDTHAGTQVQCFQQHKEILIGSRQWAVEMISLAVGHSLENWCSYVCTVKLLICTDSEQGSFSLGRNYREAHYQF